MDSPHVPVLLKEAVDALNVKPSGCYVDGTFGFGGHSLEILKRGGQVLGLDVEDAGYIEFIKKLDVGSGKLESLIFRKANFVKLGEVLSEIGWYLVDGVLLDLGTSSWEIEKSGRGFSFLRNEPLDMRLDESLTVTAADLVNGLPEKELYDIFKEYGEELRSYRFAQLISRARLLKPIKSTADLLLALELNGLNNRGRIHPATKVFQALRIAVNSELENLKVVLPIASSKLLKGGRLVVISFHSLEDRIVKNFGRSDFSLKEVYAVATPSLLEVSNNPRSRSAHIRVYEKIY